MRTVDMTYDQLIELCETALKQYKKAYEEKWHLEKLKEEDMEHGLCWYMKIVWKWWDFADLVLPVIAYEQQRCYLADPPDWKPPKTAYKALEVRIRFLEALIVELNKIK